MLCAIPLTTMVIFIRAYIKYNHKIITLQIKKSCVRLRTA